MIPFLLKDRSRARSAALNEHATVEFLRTMVITTPNIIERFHVMFVDAQGTYVGDAPLGQGRAGGLTVRLRGLFARALSLGARGIVVAHNHPSGLCRPSDKDIEATKKLKTVAEALDIQLLDHLIFTTRGVYSMRAGGDL
ncbi:MAG: JAB domain-containing protein [Pseudomonadota bacterium]